MGLALVLTTASAPAQQRAPLVVVLTSNPDAVFVRRLAAELALFGYQVEVTTRESSPDGWPHLLERSNACALIAVDQSNQSAEIVVAEHEGDGPPHHERERLDPRRRADTNAAVLAERFRARLTELGIAPATAPTATEEPLAVRIVRPPSPPPLPPHEPEKRLWLMGALGATSGGLGLMPDASLEVRAFPVRWLSTGAFVKIAPLPARVQADEGDADVRLLSGGVLIDAYPVRGGLDFKLGAGALLVSADMRGSADSPFGGRTDSVLVAAGMFRSGIALKLGPRVSAELDGFVGLCAPRIGVRFAGRSVADFGQPFYGASLGAALGVF